MLLKFDQTIVLDEAIRKEIQREVNYGKSLGSHVKMPVSVPRHRRGDNGLLLGQRFLSTARVYLHIVNVELKCASSTMPPPPRIAVHRNGVKIGVMEVCKNHFQETNYQFNMDEHYGCLVDQHDTLAFVIEEVPHFDIIEIRTLALMSSDRFGSDIPSEDD